MRLWPPLVASVLACGPVNAPSAGAPPPVSEAELHRVSACSQSVVPQANVVRVGWSRYRGRAALAVALSSPNDDLVDAYHGPGAGCELLALVGRGPFDIEVHPGPPLCGLQEARRTARDGVVTSWALERDSHDGGWAYRFEIDAEGRMHTVFVDARCRPPNASDVQRRDGAGGAAAGDGGGAAGRGEAVGGGGGGGAAPGETMAFGAARIKLPR